MSHYSSQDGTCSLLVTHEFEILQLFLRFVGCQYACRARAHVNDPDGRMLGVELIAEQHLERKASIITE